MKSLIAVLSASLMLLAAPAARADLVSDLVAHWTFNECNGIDATGRGHDATLRGTAPDACVAGPRGQGQAYPFNGSNNYFESAYSPDFDVATTVTYALWMYPSKGGVYAIRKANLVEEKHVFLSVDQRILFFLYSCMSGLDLTSADTVPLNQWTHVAATYDGSFARIYLNGEASGLRAITPVNCNVNDTTTNLFIGGSTSLFQGALDDVRIYQRALNATEINQLYRQSVKAKIEGTVDWETTHTVTCKNITQGTQNVLAATRRDDWNCEGPNLKFNSGDAVQVIIDGTRK